MKHNQYPKSQDRPGATHEESPVAGVVPPMYRLGDDSRNSEVLIDKCRVLSWDLTGREEELATIAGWENIEYHLLESRGYMFLPAGTRNARSVLSGKEAWEGEKKAVISAGSLYLQELKDRHQLVDYSFGWASMGITPQHKIFVAPPLLKEVPSAPEQESWKSHLVEELDLLLQGDDRNRQLALDFASIIKGI